MITSKVLATYLKSNAIQTGMVDRLKMIYRPYMCPFEDLINCVNKEDVVADIGCGSGQFCFLLDQFSTASAIYGYEIHEDLIRNAETLFKDKSKIEYHFGTFNGIDIPENIALADTIFLIDVLHHIPMKERTGFISQVYKRMKFGARFIVKDIDGSSPFVIFNKIHDLIFSHEIVHEVSMNKTQKMLEENKLNIIKTEKRRMYVYPHYTIIAKK